jgi:uncharacterized protein YkwD
MPALARLLATLAAVAALAVAVVAPAAPAASTAIGSCTPGASWGTVSSTFAGQVVSLVNQHRQALGLVQLQVSPTLTNAAVWKSLHMGYYGYMAHDDPAPPVARKVPDRLAACGYPAYPNGTAGWGENIAYGYATPAAVMTAWLNSPGHRANIENPTYRAIGVGAARNAKGTYYWTEDFGTRAGI